MLNSQAFLAICDYAALKKEAAGSSEMLIPIDQTISFHNLDVRDFTSVDFFSEREKRD
jgi:hypothetical protein